ncbi:MAG: hypothetical protein J0626_09790, partial [Rhodospirillaceae bacterium]|nr:hypothetical protein [Rhodospirillaceae bacterium]
MKHILFAAVAITALSTTPADAETIALVGGNVVDLAGKAPLRDAVVLIDGERIVAIGAAASTAVPS